MRGSSLKSLFLVGAHRVGRAMPAPLSHLAMRGVIRIARLAYCLPYNPLRRSCGHVAALAASAGYHHRPIAIHRRLLDQISLVLCRFVDVFKHGREAALRSTPVHPALGERVEELLAAHGSVILAVPHNVCAVFSAMGLPTGRTVLVVRNRKGRHNRVSQELIERMEIRTLEVRDLSPIALSRALLGALAAGNAVVATIDQSYRKPDAIEVEVFGLRKGFGGWAARIAAKRGVPILPCYPAAEDGQVVVRLGEPCIDSDPSRLVEHYVRFLEDNILRDPGSWAFLGDKRWRRHLAAAHAKMVT